MPIVSPSNTCASCEQERLLFPIKGGYCGQCVSEMDADTLKEVYAPTDENYLPVHIDDWVQAHDDVIRVLFMANALSGQKVTESRHVLVAMCAYPVSHEIFQSHGVNNLVLSNICEASLGAAAQIEEPPSNESFYSAVVENIISMTASAVSDHQAREEFNLNDVMVTLLRYPSSSASLVLKTILERFPNSFGTITYEGEEVEVLTEMNEEELFEEEDVITRPTTPRTPALDSLTTDLVELAKQGKIDPIIGRTEEIDSAVETLMRRKKNNVILVGDPGVGKTAIAEGIAVKMANDEIPLLEGSNLFKLDVGSLVAGTKMRGELEARLEAVIKESKATEAILFIDEIHTIIGAGASEGGLDAANILKPALASGEIKVIGATTEKEYKAISNDAALARRFTVVDIDEPSIEECEEIVQGLLPYYEENHNLKIDLAAANMAVRLADKHITENKLPDKALDLIDTAAARARMDNLHHFEQLNLETQIDAMEDTAANLEGTDITQIKTAIEGLRNQWEGPRENIILSKEDIATVVSKRTGVPIGDLLVSETKTVLDLQDRISQGIIGHEQSIQNVVESIKSSVAGLSEADKPVGSFLFSGPSGVGKTEVAKVLSKEMMGHETLIRFDMSEFTEGHTVSRLIGSSPGYVGFGRGGELTDAVRKNPHSVVLLDEIEKAHPNVWRLFLAVLDEGKLTDTEGIVVDFTHTVVIMTSNAGSMESIKSRPGFAVDIAEDRKSSVVKALEQLFPPEFLNRVQCEFFDALTDEQIKSISEKLVKELTDRVMANRSINLIVRDEIISKIATEGYDPKMGARPIKRKINELLGSPLAEALLDDNVKEGATITAKLNSRGEIVTTKRKA